MRNRRRHADGVRRRRTNAEYLARGRSGLRELETAGESGEGGAGQH